MTRVRLQRFLAQAAVASRRKSEDLIAAGVVKVNGKVVTEPGTTVDPEADEVLVKGRPVRARFAEDSPGEAIGIALHKPRGVLTARTDAHGRRTVYDLVDEPRGERLAYVGRLDLDTEGLLLMTTHGRLAHRLTHPRSSANTGSRSKARSTNDGSRRRRERGSTSRTGARAPSNIGPWAGRAIARRSSSCSRRGRSGRCGGSSRPAAAACSVWSGRVSRS